MLLGDNSMYEKVNEMIDPDNTREHRLKVKALYMEALTTFLKVYAESELSSDIELNLPLISLYINSPEFENQDCSYIKSIDDIYEMLEIETLMGMPVWRFFILSDYQKNILEKNYEEFLKKNCEYLRENYPCKRCIFFREMDTPFGYLAECRFDEWKRANSIDWTKVTKCENLVGLDTDIEKFKNEGYTYRRIKSFKDTFERKLKEETTKNLDKYKVTLEDLKDSEVSLEELSKEEREVEIFKDFGRAVANKRTSTDRRKEYRKAIILASFVEFVNLYIESEIGSGYKVNLYEILKYIEYMDFDFKSKEEFLEDLEKKIIDEEIQISKYIEKEEI